MRSGARVRAAKWQGSTAWAALLTFLAAARGTHAGAPGYEISLGIAQTDNVARVPNNTQSDTIITQGLGLTWQDVRPRLNADVEANLTYLEYLRHTVTNEVVGNLIGQARFALAPDLLFLNVSDNFGQGLVDPLAADNPANRENINYFSAGPELLLPLGATTLLEMKANYGKVMYQVSPLDDQRADGTIGLVHKLSPNSEASVNVRDEHVDFSNDVQNPDYSRQDAFVHYDAKNARTTLNVDLGYSKLRASQGHASNVLARLDASRKVSPSSTVGFALGHQYSDAGSAFRLEQTLGGANLNTLMVTQTGAPFTSDYASLAWNFQRSRTGFALSADYFKDNYQTPSTLDDKRTQLTARLSRKLTPTLELSVMEQYFRQQFKYLVGNSDETFTDLQLRWQAAQSLSIVIDAYRADRHSEAPGTNYAENRFWVRVAYGRPAESRPGPATPPLPSQLHR